MKTRVNPAFSKISFLLFHEGEDDAGLAADALPVSANELTQAAERLTKWPDLPGESDQSRLVFLEYAESLRGDSAKLVAALRNKQLAEARKIFESLHRKCDSCHHFFRYEQPTGGEPNAGPAPGRSEGAK